MKLVSRVITSYLFLALVLFMAGISVFSYSIFRHIIRDERQDVLARADMVSAYLQKQAGELAEKTSLLAQWEDSGSIIEDIWPENSLDIGKEAFLNILDVNIVLLYDKTGDPIYSSIASPTGADYSRLSDEFIEKIASSEYLASDISTANLSFGDENIIMAAAPVNLPENNQQSGWLVLGRWISREMIADMEEQSRSRIEISARPEPDAIAVENGSAGLLSYNWLQRQPLQVFIGLPGNDAGKVMLLTVERNLFLKELNELLYVVILVFVVNLFLARTLYYIFRKKISRPVRNFSNVLQSFDERGQIPARIEFVSDYEELELLGRTINKLLRLIDEKQQSVVEQKNLFQAVFEQAPVGITYGNGNGVIIAANPEFSRITGWDQEELEKKKWHEITHPEDIAVDKVLFSRFIKEEIPGYTLEKRYLRKDGSSVWTQITVARLNIPSNPEVTNVCMIEDISERIRLLDELHKSERSKDMLLKNMQGMAYRCKYDADWTMLYVSRGCRQLTGWDEESLVQSRDVSYNELISPGYRVIVRELWEKAVTGQKPFKLEYPIITKSGEMKWVLEHGTGITNQDGEIEYLEGLIIDVTDRKLHELEIEYLNQHDILTGLYNRRYFEIELQRIDSGGEIPVSLMIGDINGLKLINDAFGLETGDHIIREAAAVITNSSRSQDIVSRTGGDEFIIIMPGTGEDEAYSQMRNLKDRFVSYNKTVDDEAMRINLSFGFAVKNQPDQSLFNVLNIAEDYMRKHKLLEKKSSHSSILASIQATMYERSQETEAHAERMANLALKIGHRLGLPQLDLDKLVLLAKLHDIGKISIDNRILNKPGKLTAQEWVEMKKHPEIGYRIAANSPELISVADAILSHHERWDGKGYPQGSKGEEIPLLSRILAIVDAYDAMTEDRVYRASISKSKALEEIERYAGTQFDPHIAQIFLAMMREDDSRQEE